MRPRPYSVSPVENPSEVSPRQCLGTAGCRGAGSISRLLFNYMAALEMETVALPPGLPTLGTYVRPLIAICEA